MGTDDGWKLKLGALLVVGVSLGMSEVVGIIDKEGAVDGALLPSVGTVLGKAELEGMLLGLLETEGALLGFFDGVSLGVDDGIK